MNLKGVSVTVDCGYKYADNESAVKTLSLTGTSDRRRSVKPRCWICSLQREDLGGLYLCSAPPLTGTVCAALLCLIPQPS